MPKALIFPSSKSTPRKNVLGFGLVPRTKTIGKSMKKIESSTVSEPNDKQSSLVWLKFSDLLEYINSGDSFKTSGEIKITEKQI